MGLKLFIARRFLFSKKSHSVINIISVISVCSVAIITAAMIIILSAINGFEDTVKTLYSKFDPDIKITAVQGKTFVPGDDQMAVLKNNKNIAFLCPVIEEICILKNNDQWVHARVKGVTPGFMAMTGMENSIDGEAVLSDEDSTYYIIPGSMLAQKLGVYNDNAILPEYIRLYTPLRSKKLKQNSEAFNETLLHLGGVFSISPELDDEYVLTDIGLLNAVLGYEGEISAVEIGLKPGADENAVKAEIAQSLGKSFEVKTRYEQKELIYKTSQTEKLFIFIILVFVLVLAGFNVIAAVTMLVIDKQKDSNTLQVLGVTPVNMRRIFFMNGLLINLIGGGIGLALGVTLVLIQYHFHVIPMYNAIIDFYPVKLVWVDVLKSFAALMAIALFSSWFPVWLATRKK